MKNIFVVLLAAMVLTACAKKEAGPQQESETTTSTTEQSSAPQQDVSDDALLEIDSGIQIYVETVSKAKEAYEADKNKKTKESLVNAYIAFGDYMTYESPVSPRKGKYRRALIEYRHALELDPGNEKVKSEIKQIEDIYRSMGRPIPQDV